jgi:uncharacterized protein (DUF1697 family)
MGTWIALIRGINVGASGRLSMGALSKLFEQAGCKDIRTYVQSGNVVFNARVDSTERFAEGIGSAIERQHGFRPAVRLISASALRRVIALNPYPEAESVPQSLHVFFLEDKPKKSALARAERLTSPTESFTTSGSTLYLHAPDGIARSKFVKGIDKALDMSTTSRNWRTVTKLAEIASSIEWASQST